MKKQSHPVKQESQRADMTLHDTLIGHWSAYTYDGYGTMEDESLVFLPKRQGWFTFDRGVLRERITFLWSIYQNHLLIIEGQQYTTFNHQLKAFEQHPWDAPQERMPITIREELTLWPGEISMLILTFATPPFSSCRKFAHINDDPATITFPRFEGESPAK